MKKLIHSLILISIFSSTLNIARAEDTISENTEQTVGDAPAELSDIELEQLNEEKLRLFKIGYEYFNQKKYKKALSGFYDYMNIAEAADENYEWANFFFGVSLEKMGFSHAAVDTFAGIAAAKPNTKIVTYILSYFDTISRQQPFDNQLIIAQSLNSNEYGFIDDDLLAMVHYHQGIYDSRAGHKDWAQRHFEEISQNSPYYGRYLYHSAILAIQENAPDKAIEYLGTLLLLDHDDEKLRDTAHWTIARLLFEKQEYQRAIGHYKAIKTPVSEQAAFLLERAWNQFRLDNHQRAMGLLFSFHAPSFHRFFTPEVFILKSMIYKTLCDYDATLATADAFYHRYQQALDAIYDRKAASDPEALSILQIILNNETIKQQWQFVQLLENENQNLKKKIKNKALRSHLESIYQLKIKQSGKKLRLAIEREYERLANTLLEYQENINLVRYEAGVDRYQSITNLRYQQENTKGDEQEDNADKVIYTFQGEFWNDEFDDYKVHLADKCHKDQEWEVFFK